MITIAIESPTSRDGRALLTASDAALRSVYSADECFTLEAEALDAPHIIFLIARENATALGCIAVVLEPDYAELKRLLVRPEAQGKGVGRQLVEAAEEIAQQYRRQMMRLETGDKLAAAVHLYHALGYETCAAFGPYTPHPASLFMQKRL